MFNRIQDGKSIMIAIPAGGCSPFVPVIIGNDLVGIPAGTYGAGATGNVTVHLEGAYRGLPLHTGDTPAAGDKLYFDVSEDELTTTSSGNVWCGWAWPCVDGDATTVVAADLTVGLKLRG